MRGSKRNHEIKNVLIVVDDIKESITAEKEKRLASLSMAQGHDDTAEHLIGGRSVKGDSSVI